jgi:hypothetical protein
MAVLGTLGPRGDAVRCDEEEGAWTDKDDNTVEMGEDLGDEIGQIVVGSKFRGGVKDRCEIEEETVEEWMWKRRNGPLDHRVASKQPALEPRNAHYRMWRGSAKLNGFPSCCFLVI